MLTVLRNDPKRADLLDALYCRPACPASVETAVAEIMDDVLKNGDEAICRYLKKFDGVTLSPSEFLVSDDEIAEAEKLVDPAMKRAIRHALANIRAFTKKTLPRNWKFSPRKGVIQGNGSPRWNVWAAMFRAGQRRWSPLRSIPSGSPKPPVCVRSLLQLRP